MLLKVIFSTFLFDEKLLRNANIDRVYGFDGAGWY
jgi:hypothetical protein